MRNKRGGGEAEWTRKKQTPSLHAQLKYINVSGSVTAITDIFSLDLQLFGGAAQDPFRNRFFIKKIKLGMLKFNF